ncbi:MAG: hypothetical protein QM743_07910 [Chitinophagaceae bacterium]
MKKTAAIMFASVALFATSCKKDKKNSELVGSWKETMEREVTFRNGVQESDDTTLASGTIYQFKDDNTLNVSGGGLSFSGTYSVSGNQLTMTILSIPIVSTYTVSGSNLEFHNEDVTTEGSDQVKTVTYTYATKQ